MAFFIGKSCPVLNILIFMLTFTSWILGVFCAEQKVSYSEPYRAVIKGNNVTLRCSFDYLPDEPKCHIKWYKDGKKPIELKGTMSRNCEAWLTIYNAKTIHSGIYYCKLQTNTKSIVQCAAEMSVQPSVCGASMQICLRKVQSLQKLQPGWTAQESKINHLNTLVNNPEGTCMVSCEGRNCRCWFKPKIDTKCWKATEVNKMKTATTMKDMLILIQGILLMLCLTLPGMLFFNKNNQIKKDHDETEAYHMYEGLEVMQTAMYEDIGNMRQTEDKCSTGEQPNE